MAYAHTSATAACLTFALAASACGDSGSQTEPQARAGESAAVEGSPTGSIAGKSGSAAPTSPNTVGSSAAAGSGSSPQPSASAAGSGGAPRAQSGAAGNTPSSNAGGSPAGASGTPAAGQSGAAAPSGERFSFFMTSWAAMQRLSKSENGFGGDLRYGEADGLSGADKICREIAESSLPGSGSKTWRAFLSVTKGPNGMPVHAIDRVGEGPWYDRLGRVFAMTRADLINTRPKGADPAIINDFPNEDGVPNHAPDGATQLDNHDVLTGTGTEGKLFSEDARYTCKDWTSSVGADGTPRVGHSWPRSGTPVRIPTSGTGGGMRPGSGFPGAAAGRGAPPLPMGGSGGGRISGDHWMSALNEAGCAAGASLVEMGGPNRNNPTVGSGGGYGAIYCFALTP